MCARYPRLGVRYNNPTKWTEKKVTRIASLIRRNRSLQEIATKFNTTKSIIRNVCHYYKIDCPKTKTGKTIKYTSICKQCRAIFTRRVSASVKPPAFCSRACLGQYNRSRSIVKYTCINCKKVFERLTGKSPQPRYFCSKKCRGEFLSTSIQEAINNISSGV